MAVPLQMLFSVMDPTQGPTPVLLIDNNTLINDKQWLFEYLDTALRSFNIVGGFFKGEIKNRLVLSIDPDAILLIYGLTISSLETEDQSERPQSYQAVITLIFGRAFEVEQKLYKIVDQIKHELELTSFAIQASSIFPGLDPFQSLTDFVRSQLFNGEPPRVSVEEESPIVPMQDSMEPRRISLSKSELLTFSKREQEILKRGIPHLETGKSMEELIKQTGLTYTEFEWISRVLEKRKIHLITSPSEEVVRSLHLKDKNPLKGFWSRIKDRFLWRRRRKVSRYVLQELNNILFALLEKIETDGRSMNGEQVREFVIKKAVLLGKRLLADYFADMGFQEVRVTHDTLKYTISSIWRRNFGYSPEMSLCLNHTPQQVHLYILFKVIDSPLTPGLPPSSRELANTCMMTEGILQGIVEDMVSIDPRFAAFPSTVVEVHEVRCQSRGYDHCDFEIRVDFELVT